MTKSYLHYNLECSFIKNPNSSEWRKGKQTRGKKIIVQVNNLYNNFQLFEFINQFIKAQRVSYKMNIQINKYKNWTSNGFDFGQTNTYILTVRVTLQEQV